MKRERERDGLMMMVGDQNTSEDQDMVSREHTPITQTPPKPNKRMMMLNGSQTITKKQKKKDNNNTSKLTQGNELLLDECGVWGIWNKASGTFLVYKHEDGFQCPLFGKCVHHSSAGREVYHL